MHKITTGDKVASSSMQPIEDMQLRSCKSDEIAQLQGERALSAMHRKPF
ncbi:hypothetical protein P775_07160 [Puniceibacterium antarcticum]|uniref:Uncharacterized protein n=1 Tax=Puniceibacterium antarcticum TaxID=1206336 RepID=A0A2G8RH61_9RHOB|nr:hypothetical protein P775_07160 [Puniceibacterium antarcticum]